LPSQEDRATDTDNKYRKFGGIWTAVFEIRKRTDRQTNRHTDTLITASCTRIGGDVNINFTYALQTRALLKADINELCTLWRPLTTKRSCLSQLQPQRRSSNISNGYATAINRKDGIAVRCVPTVWRVSSTAGISVNVR